MNAIETKDLTRAFKERVAVDHLNLSVKQGELYALLGVNGAGKTTTIRMLACLLRPTSGDAFLLGDSVVTSPMKVKEKINLSPQETAVARNLTVRENLAFIAGIYGYRPDKARAKSDEMIDTFQLGEWAKNKARTLSGGVQRRLSLALALISDPDILFLDEPTLGLDVLARRELWRAIEKLKGKKTVILTTHYMEEAESLSDRVGVMAKGKLMAVGTAAELVQQTGASNFEDAFVRLAGEGMQ